MRSVQYLLLFFFVIFFPVFNGCGSSAPPAVPSGHPRPYKIGKYWYKPLPHARDFRQKGHASWYGKDFHGKKTANGEIYDMYAMTAAHKTLPLGTRVKVCNRNNGKCTTVRINDRGPFVKGRIIDLSYTAAKELGVVGPGTAPVIVEALAGPVSANENDAEVFYKGNFSVQVGAFANPDNAYRLAEKFKKKFKDAHVAEGVVDGKVFYRVRVGRVENLKEARELEEFLEENGFPGAFVVSLD